MIFGRSGLRRGLAFALAVGAAAALPWAARAETVRVDVPRYSDRTGPYFEQMAKEFQTANPGVQVKVDVVAWDELRQTLRTGIADGAGPDIAIVATPWLPDFVIQGQAEPLDGLMSAEFRNRFIGGMLAPGRIGGKTYGLPIAASARALYYNVDLLAKAGIGTPPATWDDVRADAEKLKAAGIAGFGIQGKANETDIYWYYALWTEGGEVLGKDDKAAFDSPAGVVSLTMYKAMIDDGLTEDDVTGVSREDLHRQFTQGRLAMVIAAPQLVGEIAVEAPGLKYGVAPVPRGTRAATYAVTDTAMMFHASKVKPFAWKFLDFLFTKASRLEFDENEGFLPTTKAAASDKFFAKNPRLEPFVKQLPAARFPPTVAGWDDAANVVSDALRSVYLGKATPAAALTSAAAAVDRSLGK